MRKKTFHAKQLNKAFVKDRYQLSIKDLVAEQLEKPKEEARFTSPDMQYAYGQIRLHTKAAEQCNFQIIGGETTGA